MKKIFLTMLLPFVCCAMEAQSNKVVENSLGKNRGLLINSAGMEKMLDSKVDAASTVPYGYKEYSDEKYEEFDRQMKEREWATEEGAWERACEQNTSQAYERYMAVYPYGAHVSEADVRRVDTKIAETLAGAHNPLPGIKQLEADEESMTSTIVIKNNTGYPLTVYYSGIDVKSIQIPIDGMTTLMIENGEYKLAASVPPKHIHPFAGKTRFVGGRYEMGFWVVSRSQ